MTTKQYQMLGTIIRDMVLGRRFIVDAHSAEGNLLFCIHRKEQLARDKKKALKKKK